MKTILLPAADPTALETALQIINAGGLVAFPTDTVYGLGCLISNSSAIDQLFVVKGRDSAKAIAVLIGNLGALKHLAPELSTDALQLAHKFWPGPLTLVVQSRPGLPQNLSPLPTVGVRMPDHPDALSLLTQTGPMAVTSANLSGHPNTTTAQQVFEQLGGQIPLILDGGQTQGGTPSTVVDCTKSEPLLLRPGPITIEQIQSALKG